MAYKRFYSEWTDENDWQYTLYIIPSNANVSPSFPSQAGFFDSTFTLVGLPDDFIMRDMKLSTELGEIPVGLVSQTLQMTLNIAALQGTANYDELREQLLQGSTSKGIDYNDIGEGGSLYDKFGNYYEFGVGSFQKFNTFILMVNDGSGLRPIFIGCQKYSAENELTVNKLSEILEFKIECFDVMRCIGEAINHNMFVNDMIEGMLTAPVTIDYGDGFQELSNEQKYRNYLYEDNYTDSRGNIRFAIDQTPNNIAYNTSTFERMRTKMQALFTRYMRGFTWNLSSSISLPVPFAKAWTFYQQRTIYGSIPTEVVSKPAYISELWQLPDGINSTVPKLMGGALKDPTALGKVGNAYEILKLIVENTLENYRIVYAWSAVSGWFSATYTADFIRPLTGSGITFNASNTYGDVKFKLFQETVKSVDISCSTLQGEKDNKVFPYSEQGTSGDNSKDVEIVFHNLPSATNRKDDYTKNSINAGMIVYVISQNRRTKKVDSTCQFKYSNTDAIKLQYTDVPSSGENKPYGKDDALSAAMIVEQQTAGVPYTMAYSLVKALGNAKETEISFKTKHSICGFEDVGANCTINMNDMNSLITKIYNANTGTAVITKHDLDVFSGDVELTARMYA